MKSRQALIAFALWALAAPACAQDVTNPGPPFSVNGAYNSSSPTCVSGHGCWLQTDVNGNLKVNVASGGGTGGTSSNFGDPFPATGTAAGMSQGGNMVALTGTSNSLNVNVTNTNANGQATMANSSPIVLASNQSVADPCMFQAKVNLPISFQTTSSTQIIALSGSTKIYVCSLAVIASAATVFSITGGTGSNCGTPAAVIGTTTASHGLSLAANGGLTLGNGSGTVAVTAAGSELCIVQSGAGDISGNLTYVQQ